MKATDLSTWMAEGRLRVERSRRRRKTVSVSYAEGTYVLKVPHDYDVELNAIQVAALVERLRRRTAASLAGDEELTARAEDLNGTYFDDDVEPTSVRWVHNQNTRFGSTSVRSGRIRISHHLAHVPRWVLDAVLVHELAHLRVADHGPRFKALTARYPRTEKADVFLEGFSHGLRAADGPDPEPVDTD